jgi:hypothetical protein
MALNKAQLMEVPGGPGTVGAIQAGTGILITGEGFISINPASNVTTVAGGGSIIVNPSVGVITISGPPPTPPDPTFPAGTKTCFFQPSAPVGWTTIQTIDNGTIRLVSNTGGQTGGSTGFTSAFIVVQPTGSANYSSITWSGSLSAANLSIEMTAAHTHTVKARGSQSPQSFIPTTTGGTTALNPPVVSSQAGSGQTHSHSVQGNVVGSDPVNLSSVNLTVRYVDFLICQRNPS